MIMKKKKTVKRRRAKKSDVQLIPHEQIVRKILVIRNEKVLLDVHIAELYGVETRTLKQAVRRNMERFPEDFMFELNDEETADVLELGLLPNKQNLGGARPFAFTETGVAMLSSVLKSPKAVRMNLSIMRTFVTLRKVASDYDGLLERIQEIELQFDKRFSELYDALQYLLQPENPKRRPVGYRTSRNQEED